jgi:tRNA(Ile)-lysidine synthase
VRTFCRQRGLATPPARRLETLLDQLSAAADAQVHVTWPGACARVWRGRLYLFAEERLTNELLTERGTQSEWRASWDGNAPLKTPRGDVFIVMLGEAVLPLTATWRRGGEVMRLAGRGRRDLKRLLAEAGVPPWERNAVIVIWAGESCVAALKAPNTLLYQAAGWQFEPRHQALC